MGKDRNQTAEASNGAAPSRHGHRKSKSNYESESEPDPDSDSDSDTDLDLEEGSIKSEAKRKRSRSSKSRTRIENGRETVILVRHHPIGFGGGEKAPEEGEEGGEAEEGAEDEEEKRRRGRIRKGVIRTKRKIRGRKVPSPTRGESMGSSKKLICDFLYTKGDELTSEQGSERGSIIENKRPEFIAWLVQVKQVNLKSLPDWEEKQLFKDFMEDHNTAAFPSKKYYDLDAYYLAKMKKEEKRGYSKVQDTERTVFDDEEQRGQELRIERETHKEEQVVALKGSMLSGMLSFIRRFFSHSI